MLLQGKKETNFRFENVELGITKCFIINLPLLYDRLDNCIQECNKYNLWAERIEAVTTDDLKKIDLNSIYHKTNDYSMKNGEIACFLSHIKALKKVSLEKDGRFMIFEDDIKFRDNFFNIAREIKEELNNIEWDIVFFGSTVIDINNIIRVSKNLYETCLSTGAWAYMLTPETARKILSMIFPFSLPYDLLITNPSPSLKDKEKRLYDKRFNLKTLRVHTGEKYNYLGEKIDKDKEYRLGIVDELSTRYNSSTSQT